MKKTLSSISFILIIILSSYILNTNTHAACPPAFFIGKEYVSGCPSPTNSPQIEGFSIDLENDKIILNNYNGGGIYYFCHASCSTTKTMEIELIGVNSINSSLSVNAPIESYTQRKYDAGFLNISPTFTGTGTLNIEATTPFAFEDTGTENATLIIANPNSTAQTPSITFSNPAPKPENITGGNDSSSEQIDDQSIINNNLDEKTESITKQDSFFETTIGIISLISIPTILLIVIAILSILLIREKKKHNPINNIYSDQYQTESSNNQNHTLETNQQS